MAIQSTNIDNQSDGLDISGLSGQTMTVVSNVIVQSETASGIVDDGGGKNRIVNNGQIAGAYGVNFTGSDSVLLNNSNALVYGGYGVHTAGDFSSASAGPLRITNYGNIYGDSAGEDDENGGAVIRNYGSIGGGEAGVHVGGGLNSTVRSETISNNGTISGHYGVEIGSDSRLGTFIYNSGTISGDDDAIVAFGFHDPVYLVNHGMVKGNISLLDVDGDTITNSGRIEGSVNLGSGTNFLHNEHGSIDGGIFGGKGSDYIYAGKDGDTIYGGGGHDFLTGGVGDDTFAFSSYTAADTDRIFGFKVGDDTVQLDHTKFTKLKAGASPEFSVGTKAASATDYLFYNSTGGQLYYDADGSGTGRAYLVANLGGGLNLTSADFKIV